MTRSPTDRIKATKDALSRALVTLADRNFVRFVLEYDRARRSAGDRADVPANLLDAAERLGVRALVWGVETAIRDAHVAPITGLRALESDLDALANAWFPLDAPERVKLRDALPVERRAIACPLKYRPSPAQVEGALALVRGLAAPSGP